MKTLMLKLSAAFVVVAALSGCAAGNAWLQSADPDAKIDGRISAADFNAVLVKGQEALDLYGGFGSLPATAQSAILVACALSDALSTSLDEEAKQVCDAATGRTDHAAD